MTATCFVSYNREDIPEGILLCFINEIRSLGSEKIRILIDEDLRVGDDINAFVSGLWSVEAAIVLMTPGYKRKFKLKNGWVYDEFNIIHQRLLEYQKQMFTGSESDILKFALIPVLWSGTKDDSIIDDIRHIRYVDLSQFRPVKSKEGTYIWKSERQPDCRTKIQEILDVIISNHSSNSAFYKKRKESYYEKLFITRKAEYIDFETQKKIFAKTKAFLSIDRQSGLFLIGRKGSGKSTITGYITNKNRPSYKGCVNLKADSFDMEMLYAYFNESKLRSDTYETFGRLNSFIYTWGLFFYIRCMYIVLEEYKADKLSNKQSSHIRPIHNFILNILASNGNDCKQKLDQQLFIYSLKCVSRYFDHCIDCSRSNDSYFLSDLISKFDFDQLLDWVCGRDALTAFFAIIETCTRRILITLDNFDTAFDEYRKTSICYYKDDFIKARTNFEISWLRALLAFVMNIKYAPDHGRYNDFAKLIDFCLAIPKDRFIEIRNTERDGYIYGGKYISMNWTGIELSIVLRKRLELLGDFQTSKEMTPPGRLGTAIKRMFPNLPDQIKLISGQSTYLMPLFLYVLRFSFWRPRGILIYFAAIFALSEEMAKRNLKISDAAIKRIVRIQTSEVVQTEFINEFKSLLINIEDILRAFSDQKHILSYEEMKNILGALPFCFSYRVEPVKDFGEKVLFLYEVGFIGFHVGQKTMKKYELIMKDVFYFNEGDILIKTLGKLDYTDIQFVIHPIFRGYLNLELNSPEIVLNYDWDYILENEAFSHSIV